ncbi:MAG: FlgD immunoglobulin-like domain containing protein [Spirochaetota bacterium]
MSRPIRIALAFLVIAASPIAAQYEPPTGGEDLYDLYSPLMLAEGAPAVADEGPQADTMNPAISGLVQRTTLDASYLAVTGFGSPVAGGGWQGHVANLGLVSPTRFGVFSGSAHVLAMPLSGMRWGTTVAIHGSAAKELYPGWLAGVGMRVMAGGADRFDVGAAVDLGVVREMGSLGFMQNVRWGVALQNMGKWYEPLVGASALSGPFTPVAGVNFDAVSNDWLTVRASGSLSAPAFQNLRLGVGGRATFFDTVSLHAGWKADLRQLIEPQIARRSLVPSFGLSVSFSAGLGEEGFAAERGWTRTEVRTAVVAAPLYNDVWAIGGGINAPLGIVDTEGPRVSIDYGQPVAISPNNDGTQDALVVPIEISDERFVVGWTFEVRDEHGEIVRTIRNKDDRPENTGFQNVVDRVVEVRTGVPVPREIRWDGSTDDGDTAPDGEYSFQLLAADDNGNRGSSAAYRVVVDTTPPRVDVVAPAAENRVFSPNGDGIKDTFPVVQSGSVEREWFAEISNASGRTVRTLRFLDSAPRDFEWDGRGDEGAIQPDGVYRYRISATDRAGNRAVAELPNIILNTESTPVGLEISSSEFSPNGDGRQDTLTIRPDVPSNVGIVSWEIAVRSVDGERVRTYADTAGSPASVVFDGRSDRGALLEEGDYFAELEVVYRNGNRPSAQSAEFTIDVTAPLADARADVPLFSPNGDGNLDTVTFFNEASREQRWRGVIIDADGASVRTWRWTAIPEQRIVWNGRRDDGRLASDGRYTYVLATEDAAGNIGSSEPVVVEIDTSEGEIGLRAEFEAFSPNSDGVRDRQRLFLRVDREDEVARYRVDITSEDGDSVRTFEGRGEVADNVVWNGGLGTTGRRVPDGVYRARLETVFENGVELEAQTARFVVDTAPPTVALQTPYTLFSPDGDGNRDVVRIEQATSDEDEWRAAIRDADGEVVREYLWRGEAESFVWDGTDAAGNRVEDGVYTYEISASDRAGNTVIRGIPELTVDTRIPRLFVTSTTSAFSPNDDGTRDELAFDLYADLIEGAEQWRLTVRTRDGLIVRRYSGTDLRPERRVSWDGRDAGGELREGVFVAEFAVDYEKGNEARVISSPVRVDVSPPNVEVSLDPIPFSPDNDGVDDELVIGLDVEDASAIQAWRFEILDRNRRFFTEFTGRGHPASRLTWDGRASDGELVISAEDYPYRFTISDELGNVTVTEGIIPVDILVVRDGDRLKVQISNITFAPNSPQLVLDPDDERGAKNRAILERLAQIFDKYSSYNIRIEGHAVNVTGTEREEREELQPLSLARAETVREAMIDAGISERRISVLGRGGTEPIVPHSDLDNRWKNRRVEFILIR